MVYIQVNSEQCLDGAASFAAAGVCTGCSCHQHLKEARFFYGLESSHVVPKVHRLLAL